MYSFPFTAKKVKNQLLPSGGECSGPQCSENSICWRLFRTVTTTMRDRGYWCPTQLLWSPGCRATDLAPVACGVVARGWKVKMLALNSKYLIIENRKAQCAIGTIMLNYNFGTLKLLLGNNPELLLCDSFPMNKNSIQILNPTNSDRGKAPGSGWATLVNIRDCFEWEKCPIGPQIWTLCSWWGALLGGDYGTVGKLG